LATISNAWTMVTCWASSFWIASGKWEKCAWINARSCGSLGSAKHSCAFRIASDSLGSKLLMIWVWDWDLKKNYWRISDCLELNKIGAVVDGWFNPSSPTGDDWFGGQCQLGVQFAKFCSAGRSLQEYLFCFAYCFVHNWVQSPNSFT
jgi:hypothetical protein